jgi:hypothetical protein
MGLIKGTAQGRTAVTAGAETHPLRGVPYVGLAREVRVAQRVDIDE